MILFTPNAIRCSIGRIRNALVNMPDAISDPMGCYCLNLLWNKSSGGDAKSLDGRKIEFKATSNYDYALSSFGLRCNFDDLGFLETDKCEIAYANEFDKYAVETYEKTLIQK